MTQTINKIAVIGGGAMGQGIAMLISQRNLPVVVKEISEELAQKTLRAFRQKIDRAVSRGQIMSGDAQIAKELFSVTADYADLADVDLAIEAVFEDLNVKKKVFKELDENLPPHAILATNTSSLSISQIADVTNRPDKVIGMHFFNPPITMSLIEMIMTSKTSEETVETVARLSQNLGKTPIKVKECPAFLVNRLLMPYLNEAMFLLSETNLDTQKIEQAAQRFGWPLGPYSLLDYLGIDIAYHTTKVIQDGYGERIVPAPILSVLYEAKRFGHKNGAGFFVYSNDKKYENLEDIRNRLFPNREDIDPDQAYFRMMSSMINEAFLCLEEEIASTDDIETGMRLGLGFPAALVGPLHWAQDKLPAIKDCLEESGKIRLAPSKLLVQYAQEEKQIFEDDSDDW